MTDIVERLRKYGGQSRAWQGELLIEAADEIERLRKFREENSGLYLRIGEQMSEIEQLRKDVQNLNRDCMMLAGERR